MPDSWKRQTEFIANSYLKCCMLLQQNQLGSAEAVDTFKEVDLHIYMICSAQRITIDPHAFSWSSGRFFARFRVLQQDSYREIEVSHAGLTTQEAELITQ